MALRLISGRDSFSKCLSWFKFFRGHLDQTRPNSSNNVRKQISIGCYYDHSVFTPFKPVRFEILVRTKDEYKCNRGIILFDVPFNKKSTFSDRGFMTAGLKLWNDFLFSFGHVMLRHSPGSLAYMYRLMRACILCFMHTTVAA